MAVTHRLVLPEGAAPDSISAEDWNAEHDGVSGGGGSFDGILPEGTTYSQAGEPRVEFADGVVYIGDGDNPIGATTPRIYSEPDDSDTRLRFIAPRGITFASDAANLERSSVQFVITASDSIIAVNGNMATAGTPIPGPADVVLNTHYWRTDEETLFTHLQPVAVDGDLDNPYFVISAFQIDHDGTTLRSAQFKFFMAGDLRLPSSLQMPSIPTADPADGLARIWSNGGVLTVGT